MNSSSTACRGCKRGGTSAESTSIKGTTGTGGVGSEAFGPRLTHLLKAQNDAFVAKPEAKSITAELESTAMGSLDKSHFDLSWRVASLSLGATSCLRKACFIREDCRDRFWRCVQQCKCPTSRCPLCQKCELIEVAATASLADGLSQETHLLAPRAWHTPDSQRSYFCSRSRN